MCVCVRVCVHVCMCAAEKWDDFAETSKQKVERKSYHTEKQACSSIVVGTVIDKIHSLVLNPQPKPKP